MKSPIKDKILQLPGDSLRELREQYIENHIRLYLYWFAMVCLLTILECVRGYFQIKYSPLTYIFLNCIVGIVVYIKLKKAQLKLRCYNQGLDGEIAVGQFLDDLRNEHLTVLHDIKADGFNLDHVIVSKFGIYVVETKTLSKPDKGDAKLYFDGQQVLLNNIPLERNPVSQATANAKWLKSKLKKNTGKDFKVQAIVVFPGWFVIQAPHIRYGHVWVINPKAIRAFIKQNNETLCDEDYFLCAYKLRELIRLNNNLK